MNKIDKYLNEAYSESDLDNIIEDLKMALDDLKNQMSAGKGNPKSLHREITKELNKLGKMI